MNVPTRQFDWSTYIERLEVIHGELGISNDYGKALSLPMFAEAQELAGSGKDFYGRDLYLTNATFAAWNDLHAAARTSGIHLAPVSGFRSVERQTEIFRQKLARGLTIPEILTVNAAPGYSQHHTGCALDITDETTSSQPLEEDFELTPSFAWLVKHGSMFGFSLEYPRSNRYGFIYEPWHWVFIGVEDYKLKR